MSPRVPTSVEEYRLSQVEERLKAGASTMAAIKEAIEAANERITAETRISPWKAIGIGLGMAAVVFSAGGAFVKVNHTSEVVEKHEGSIREVQTGLEAVQGEQKSLRAAIEDGQKAINLKLDKALQPDPLGRRRPR